MRPRTNASQKTQIFSKNHSARVCEMSTSDHFMKIMVMSCQSRVHDKNDVIS